MPAASTPAMVPPPAPMVWMSIEGVETWYPAIIRSSLVATVPFDISSTSQEVPPISIEMRLPASAVSIPAPSMARR
jgi:hypothetical protein